MNTIDKIAVAIAIAEDGTAYANYAQIEEYHRDLARAIVEHLDKCGDVVVPEEPTEAMMQAGYDHMVNSGCNPLSDDAQLTWHAMIAAAKESNRDV